MFDMLYILNKSEEIVGVLSNSGDLTKITPYFDDKHLMDLDNGSESYEFSTRGDAPESQFLEIGNYIAFDYKGDIKLFSIVDIEETHSEQFIKTVYAESCGFELLNNYVRPITFKNATVSQFAESILTGTSFKIGEVSLELSKVQDIDVNTPTTVYKLIQDIIIGEFGAEICFRVKIANNRIIGKYLDLFYKRGRQNLYRFEYGVNMSKVVRRADASELATALIGVGTNNLDFKSVYADDKPLNQDFYVNEDAFNRYNVRGRHIFGVFNYETDSAEELLNKTREEAEKRGVPKLSYDIDIELLGQDVRLGDTVYVIDNAFTPPLHLEARIRQLEISKSNPSADKCILANFKEVSSNINDQMRALSDKLVYVESNVKDVDGLKEKIEALQVGGRNLLLDSVRKTTNNSYPTAIFTLSQQEPYIEGQEYTLSISGQLGEGKRAWSIFNSGGTLEMCQITDADRRPDGRYVKTFKWIKGADAFLGIYPLSSSVTSNSTITWVKLEYGNVGSDHSYAQEDIDQVVNDKINKTETALNQNISNSVESATNSIMNNVTDKINTAEDVLNTNLNNSIQDAKDTIMDDVSDKINTTETILNQNIDGAVQNAKDDIMTNVSDNYANKVTVTEMQTSISSQFEQTNSSIEINFNRVNDYTVKVGEQLNQYKEDVKTHIRFSENGMELGKVDSPFTATLDNKKLAFLENNNEVAYISNNKMYITQAEVNDSLKIGSGANGFFTWKEGINGNLSLKWSKA